MMSHDLILIGRLSFSSLIVKLVYTDRFAPLIMVGFHFSTTIEKGFDDSAERFWLAFCRFLLLAISINETFE